MKHMITATINALRTDQKHTLREIADGTGIQITRVFRIKAGKTPDADEIIALADFYQINEDKLLADEVAKAREIARQQAFTEIWEKAEIKVAQKFGITPEVMEWRITDPKFTTRKEVAV